GVHRDRRRRSTPDPALHDGPRGHHPAVAGAIPLAAPPLEAPAQTPGPHPRRGRGRHVETRHIQVPALLTTCVNAPNQPLPGYYRARWFAGSDGLRDLGVIGFPGSGELTSSLPMLPLASFRTAAPGSPPAVRLGPDRSTSGPACDTPARLR